jgi:hypothetical protein
MHKILTISKKTNEKIILVHIERHKGEGKDSWSPELPDTLQRMGEKICFLLF